MMPRVSGPPTFKQRKGSGKKIFGTVRPLSLEESETVRKKANASRILPARFLYRDKKHVKGKIDPEKGWNPKARLCVVGNVILI